MPTDPGPNAVVNSELAIIFGVSEYQVEFINNDSWEVSYEEYKDRVPVNLPVLMKVCAIMECEPEELFWSPDIDNSGCYYAGDTPNPTLVFEIRRKNS